MAGSHTSYKLEISPSNRSTCKGACKQKIDKGEIRFSSEAVSDTMDFPVKANRHLYCVTARVFANALKVHGELEHIPGFESLNDEDQATVRAAYDEIVGGHAADTERAQEEKERIKEEKAAEKARLKEEKAAEKQRLKEEKAAEKQRLKQAKAAAAADKRAEREAAKLAAEVQEEQEEEGEEGGGGEGYDEAEDEMDVGEPPADQKKKRGRPAKKMPAEEPAEEEEGESEEAEAEPQPAKRGRPTKTMAPAKDEDEGEEDEDAPLPAAKKPAAKKKRGKAAWK